MLRGLYDWTLSLAERRDALWVLAVVSFVESSVFPIPPDVLMIPMILAAPRRAFLIAGVATVSSVLGGVLGYALGAFFFETVGEPVLGFYGYTDKFAEFQATYNEWGAWAVLIAGVTPFPYKVITIASGVAGLDPVTFMAASVVSRGARFFLVAALLWQFGPPIRIFIEKYLPYLAWAFFILLIGGFVAIRYLF